MMISPRPPGTPSKAHRRRAAIDADAWDACREPVRVKPRPTLVPARAILAVAQLITEQQAARGDGWREVSAADHLDAAQRHLLKHQAGEMLDESGHPHRVREVEG